ncbi:hypothetical protein [Hymenobacter saemangeumensis]|uniref:hypothetical protein n=1 Tax=Hymenobacter saemangeumensis TaxID=1084522 RepID=UPI0031E5EDCB
MLKAGGRCVPGSSLHKYGAVAILRPTALAGCPWRPGWARSRLGAAAPTTPWLLLRVFTGFRKLL